MLSLLLGTISAGSACGFKGGALVGAQAGYTYAQLKKLTKTGAITQTEAETAIGVLATALTTATTYGFEKVAASGPATNYDAAVAGYDSTTKTLTIKVGTKGDTAATNATVAALVVAEAQRYAANIDKGLTTVKILVVHNASTAPDGTGVVAVDAVKNFDKKAASTKRFQMDAETKYTSNNGFAGLHVGYLGAMNDQFLLGGLVEGNWVFGQDMKNDVTSTTETDMALRFNANLFLRAMFKVQERFMIGADVGARFQEIRTKKLGTATTSTSSSDKDSKWYWAPAARFVLGFSASENVLATAFVGGSLPIEQDSVKTLGGVDQSGSKAKYFDVTGGVGVSYAFGG